ncbi:MAG: glycosyltransferase family 4 protein [Nitrospiraceae bacterium]
MIRIAIDLTALLPRPTGVDNYMTQLLVHLGKVDHEHRYKIFVNYEDRHVFRDRLPDNFSVLPVSVRPRAARLLFQQIGLPALAAGWGADVVHSPSFIMPWYRGSRRHVLTVYDMTSFSLPDCHIPLRRSALYRAAVLHSIRHADLVTVPSYSTQEDILALAPQVSRNRIRVISPGIGEEFHPSRHPIERESPAGVRLPPSYILYVGTIEPRKNLIRLVECYRRLIATDHLAEHLVLVGQLGWGYESLLAQLESAELRGRVHLTGYVSQQDLPAIYRGARLFVYPSLQEGFGFPPLEAMACGVPTISSQSSSLTENLQGAAELVPPDDAEALTDAMRRLLWDESLRAKRREQGLARAALFSWRSAAEHTKLCYVSATAGERPGKAS